MKPNLKVDRFWLILLLTILLPCTAAFAQDTTMTVTVTHIAGENMYIDAGAEDGISVRDTLTVFEANRFIGRLLVVSTASKQSILAFAGRAFAVTIGNRFVIAFPKQGLAGANPSAEAIGDTLSREATPESIFERRLSARQRSAGGVRLNGRLMINLSLLDTETLPQSAGAQSIGRTFMTPSVNLNTTISNLPSDARIRVYLRSDYRHSSISSLSPSHTFRAYQLSIEKEFAFGSMQFGRFYDRSTSMGGYWDGLSLMLGSHQKAVGASFGYMPDQSNEGFTTLYPRFSGYARIETSSTQSARYRAAVAYHEIHPDVRTNYLQHRYAGFDHDLAWGPIYFNQNIQFDQDPTSSGWVVSQLQTHTRFRIVDEVTLRGGYTIRQPYRIFTSGNPLSIRRDQAEAGVSFNKFGGSIGGDYRAQFTRGSFNSRSLTAYFTSPVVAGFGLSGFSNHWKSDFGTALYLCGAVSILTEAMQFRIDYGFYRSSNTNQSEPIDGHRYSLSASVPLLDRFYWNVRTSFQRSDYLRSLYVNTSLQIRL